MAKRSLDDEVDGFTNVSDIHLTSPNAKVQGAVKTVSPMKTGSGYPYFDGEITDGKGTMRIYGFDSSVRRRLLEFEGNKHAVSMSKCEVKKNRSGEELEVNTLNR